MYIRQNDSPESYPVPIEVLHGTEAQNILFPMEQNVHSYTKYVHSVPAMQHYMAAVQNLYPLMLHS